MITNLIEPRMGKVILNHLIENNCPEFHSGLLGTYFFKMALGSDCLELCYWQTLIIYLDGLSTGRLRRVVVL